MNKAKLIVIFIFAYVVIIPGNISGDLSRFQYEVIELAYTNGFLKGMSIDDEIINELLKDKEKLNDFARKAAREYMDKVVELNQTGPLKKEKSKKKKSGETNNTISF